MAISAATRPIALAVPVAVTTAWPRPRTTTVPADTASAVRAGPVALSTGTDSPVSAASSTSSAAASATVGVGRHDVALGQHQQVADDHLGGRDLLLVAVAQHPGLRCGQLRTAR